MVSLAHLPLGYLTGELRIERIVDHARAFKRNLIIRTHGAYAPTDQIQTRCCWLQGHILYGVGRIHHPCDTLQDWIMQVILMMPSRILCREELPKEVVLS